MALQPEQIVDLVTDTQRELGKLKWTPLASDLQEHTAMQQILPKKRVGFGSGEQVQFQVMVAHSGAAKNVGLYAEDAVNVGDVMKTGVVPWRNTTTNYAFERTEVAINRKPARIVNLVKSRRVDALTSLAELMEGNFWQGITALDSEVDPYGLNYWITRSATEGFNGGNPTGFSSGCAGLSSSTYPRYSNWTAQYTSVTKEDLIRKMRKAARQTKFKPPVPQPTYNTGDNYGFYTNDPVIGLLEEALEAQNDNLGNDVASKDGQVMFHRRPVQWVPYLDDDSTNPIYGINWGVMKVIFLSGEYMVENKPKQSATQHKVYEVFVDLTYNLICRDRRRNFVINTA